MRYLIPEIASSIGFCVTTLLFTLFVFLIWQVLKKDKVFFDKQESLPLSDD